MKVEKDYEEFLSLLNQIKNKKISDRPSDKIDIELLEKTRLGNK